MIRHLPDPSTDHDRAPDFEGLTRALIQKVGQRFIDSRGNAYLACEFDANSIDGFPWKLRDERCGTLHWYSESGEWIAGSKDPSFNLVGPAPDAEDREQLKADNLRLIEENGKLKYERDDWKAKVAAQVEPFGFSADDYAEMIDDAETFHAGRSPEDALIRLAREKYVIDRASRMEGEGFSPLFEEELIVGFDLRKQFAFTVKPEHQAGDEERDFVADRLEAGDQELVLYSVRAK